MALRRTARISAVAVTASTLIAGALVAAAAPASAFDRTEVTGLLDDRTPYRFVVPADWNGTVYVELDFAASAQLSGTVEHLLQSGAAYGGTTRTITGWDIAQAIDNQVDALERFEAEVGPATRRISTGTSMGGFVAAGVAQRRPRAVDGVASFCGGLSGSVSQWNQKLDTVYTLSRLLDPEGTLPVTGIPADVSGAVDAWRARLAEAQSTPEGRARIALAAALGQLPAWGEGAPRPSARDEDAYQSGWYGALAGDGLPYIGQAMSSRRSLEALTGGNPSWNDDVDYRAHFAAVSTRDRRVVERLYRSAGLSLDDDLGIVDSGPRISADPDAVARFERGVEFDGSLRVPVVTMSNIGDQISTVAQQDEYADVVDDAGNGRLLRQTYVESVGHCAFTDAEKVAAIDLLNERLDDGRWKPSSAPAMNRAAKATGLGESRFVRFTPDDFLRPYTPAPAIQDYTEATGALENGTAYSVLRPLDWGGTLVLDADLQDSSSEKVQWLLEKGHAVATRARTVTDWNVRDGADDLLELRDIASGLLGRDPQTTIVTGASLGGLVTRTAVDAFGETIDGAIPMCGGGAGLVGMWNHRLDATFALKTLIGDAALELVDITDQETADATLAALVEQALATPHGRARLALAGAIGGVSDRPVGGSEPASRDVETRLSAIAASISSMLLRRSVLEQTAGGNISWNVGVDYSRQLDLSGERIDVRRLYREAGLDLDTDLAVLADAERISAAPAAAEWARSNGVYDGVLEMPVLDLYTETDPRASLSEKTAYERVVTEAGSGDMLRQAVVDRSGHCAFTAGEYAAAVDALLERIDTGAWGRIAGARELSARAEELQKATPVALGGAAFIEARRVPEFPRFFSASTPSP